MGQMTAPFRTHVPVTLTWKGRRIHLMAFLDSGAIDCIVDINWARRNRIPTRSLPYSCPVFALDGRPLGRGSISEVTDGLSVFSRLGGHSEAIQFFLADSLSFPIILGHAWLSKHNP